MSEQRAIRRGDEGETDAPVGEDADGLEDAITRFVLERWGPYGGADIAAKELVKIVRATIRACPQGAEG